MKLGYTLVELVIALLLAGFVLAIAIPRAGGLLDALGVDAAARDVTSVLSAARQLAVDEGRRVRVRLSADSLRVDTLGRAAWAQFRARPGPLSRGASLSATNAIVTFSPLGITWGVSNTSVTLTRGSHVETVVVSRVGRVRRG